MSEQDKTDTAQMDALNKSTQSSDKTKSADAAKTKSTKKSSTKAKPKSKPEKDKGSNAQKDEAMTDAFQSGRRVWPD